MNWDDFINEQSKKDYFKKLSSFLASEEKKYTIFPKKENIFKAFGKCSFKDTRCIILGQDCYHGDRQANGLAFSVEPGVRILPSLLNILKERRDDIGLPLPKHGDLTSWAESGVLLINSVLTVRKGEPASHQNKGWEIFTDAAIKLLNDNKDNLVFILWGNFAKQKIPLLTNKSNLILSGAHPSPYSANNGFFGGKYFSKTNIFLKSNGLEQINWHLKDDENS
jgi:uracil-DNA glycosylase